MNRYIIGIDPGVNGGIAVLDDAGVVIDAVKMPPTMLDIYDYLRGVVSSDGVCAVCYMEKVGMGMPGQSSKATATFSRHCGHLEMALLALGVQTYEVTPQKWMKALGMGSSKGYTKTEWKNKLKGAAQQLFPMLGKKVTLSTSDALLIAVYGKKQETGR